MTSFVHWKKSIDWFNEWEKSTYQNRNPMLFSESNCQWTKRCCHRSSLAFSHVTRVQLHVNWKRNGDDGLCLSLSLSRTMLDWCVCLHTISAMRWLTFCSLCASVSGPFGHWVRCMCSILTPLRTHTIAQFARRHWVYRQLHYFHNTIIFFFDWCNILFSTGAEFYLFFT